MINSKDNINITLLCCDINSFQSDFSFSSLHMLKTIFYLHGVGLHSMVEVVVTPESCRPPVVVIGNVRLLNLKVMRVVTFGHNKKHMSNH